jgi:hypothetical protein
MWTVVAIVSGYAGFVVGFLLAGLLATSERCDAQADSLLRDLTCDLHRLERDLR